MSLRKLSFPLLGAFALALTSACNNDAPAGQEAGTETGDGDGDPTGDGDGDGDGDPTGDGDGDPTGDGDGDPTGDGDGDGDGDPTPPCPYDEVAGSPDVVLEVVAEGLTAPTFVIGHPLEPDRLYVTQKSGDIVIIEPGSTAPNPTPFLSLSVNDFSEMGVLSMDFHPDFPDDPRVYVHYSPSGQLRSRVSEFTLDPQDPDIADPDSERIIYDKPQSQANHNGGQVIFGPDGYLYFSIGDGGEQGDPNGRAQSLDTHYGKIHRVSIEPSNGEEYSIPADNPFVDTPNALPEIWAYGLRNPWRFSFDSATGTMYIGDVGQNAWEEIDIGTAGGNYGWNPMEGNHCYAQNDCDTSAGPNELNADGYIAPIIDYGGAQRSVSGGYVYRSCEVPGWHGRYFYADYVLNRLWALTWDGAALEDHGQLATPNNISSFGTNAWGDVYLVETNIGFGGGGHPSNSRIFRVAPAR
ncbi:MAG: PQQ-dependent sugar dehydrogenase [Enhygromyxa sp.]